MRSTPWRVVALVATLAVLTLTSAQAAAQDPNPLPTHHLYYQTGTFARWNPIGLGNLSQLGYRYRLYPEATSPLLKDCYLMAGLATGLNPAFVRYGPLLEAKPLAVLRLTASWERLDHFGTFGILQSFPRATSDHSDSVRAEGQDAGRAYVTDASQLILAALLQAKVGPVAARSNLRAVWSQANLRPGDTTYWDSLFDQLMPDGGWMFTTDTDLLWVPGGPLTLGLRHTWSHVNYPDAALQGTPNTHNTQHRLGPLLAWTFSKNPGDAFDEPTLFLLVNWFLQHPHRTGQDVSQAVPYTVLGFSFKGTFTP